MASAKDTKKVAPKKVKETKTASVIPPKGSAEYKAMVLKGLIKEDK
tara:strand:+ start:674 stop:811 length:138 start_codon:yes stop_codon:yes gene_type:complete